MSKTNGYHRSFRLWAENRTRLDYASEMGLNASELVNEVLAQNLKQAIEQARQHRLKKLKESLSVPIP